MSRNLDRVTTLLVLVAGVAIVRLQLGADAQSTPTPVISVQGEAYPAGLKATLDVPPAALRRAASRVDQTNRASLEPVSATFATGPSEKPGARQVGFARDIPSDVARRFAPSALRWTAVSGGRVAVVSVRSPGAVALRLGIRVQSLPSDAELRFFGSDGDDRVLGPERLADIRQATRADDREPYWSPVVGGDIAGVEIFVPTSADSTPVVLSVPLISHLVAAPWSREKAAGSCEVNIVCQDATWGTVAKSVAKMVFSSGGSSFLCTGTLLADADTSTFIPYFLTANHCIGTASEASSLNTFWMYQTTTCGGSTPASGSQLTSGAVILATSTTTDFTFLRLNSPAPGSAFFAGWTTATPANNTSMTGIHHPDGDFKKISFGVIEGVSGNGGSVTGSGDYLRVHWNTGVTEPGSSGSGLFLTSSQQLVGQLRGGLSSCSATTSPDWYGRFSNTYPSIAAYLSAPPPDSTPPTVTITSPTSGSGYTASGALLTIGGSAADNVGVTQVFWANNRGGSGTASGTTSWSASFGLQRGLNVITVTARDAVGNSTSDVLTVNYLSYDVNGDGLPDLMWRNYTTGANVVWYLNGANMIGQVGLPPVTDLAWQLAANADVNGDGQLDMIWRNSATGANVVWYLSGATMIGQASLPAVTDLAWQLVASADVNRDGAPDLIWRNTTTGANSVWYLNGATMIGSASFPSVADLTWQLVASADMNLDGSPDLIWRNALSGANLVWYMNGAAFVSQASLPSLVDPTWQVMAAFDANGDQVPDLIWRNSVTGANVVWYLNGTSLIGQASFPTVADLAWRIVGAWLPQVASDFNGDGHSDLTWRNTATGANVVWYLNGTSLLSQASLPAVADSSWRIAVTTDVNGDTHPDLVWRNTATGANVVWYLNGATFLGQASLPSVPDLAWQLVASADINGDTHPDLIWRNTGTGANVVWYMNGATLLSQASLPSVSDLTWQLVASTDINLDRHPDLVWRNTVTGTNLVWYLNGTSLGSQASLPTVADTAWKIAGAADVDGDGHPDLVWRNTTTGANVVWYLSGTSLISQASLPSVADTNWTARSGG